MVNYSASQNLESNQTLINLLNEALAIELICVRRYKAHYYASQGFAGPEEDIKLGDADYREHVDEEQRHVDRIAERINQLGGQADFNPQILWQRGYIDYTNTGSLLDTLNEDLIAERIAIDIYMEMIRFIADRDPETRALLQDIVEHEEEHAARLVARIETRRAMTPPPVRAAALYVSAAQ